MMIVELLGVIEHAADVDHNVALGQLGRISGANNHRIGVGRQLFEHEASKRLVAVKRS